MWHVGLLYRIGDLLELLLQKPMSRAGLLVDFPNYRSVATEQLVDITLEGRWLEDDNNHGLILTPAGRDLIAIRGPVPRLRSQVRTLMERLSPPWAAALVQGRKAFAQYAPAEVVQCFREAAILDSLDEDVIAWWDQAAARYRQDRDLSRIETGRKGERLSYLYELNRTGRKPYWIALEFEGAGYDLKSQVLMDDERPLLIEVKTSAEAWENAKFHLTRHEWEVLKGEPQAVLHLWSLANHPREHAVIPIQDLGPHIPENQGSGQWENIECPFSTFTPSPNVNGGGLE